MKTRATLATMLHTRRSHRAFLLAASLALTVSVPGAFAQTTSVWDGGGANGSAGTAANWVGDVAPVPAANRSLQFAGTTRLLITNAWDAGTGFDNILFASGAGAFNYTGASRLTINGNITNSSTNLQTISVQRANADQLGINFSTGKTHTINAASGDILISGAIQFNTGANVINKEGNFTLTMANPLTNASYNWRMNVNAGTLVIGSTGSLGFANSHSTTANATNGFTVASGATLAVANLVTDAQITSMLGTGNFAAGSSLGFDTGLGTAAGNRIYSANLTDALIGGALGVQKRGSNALILSGNNTYGGNTAILAGVLAAAGKSSLPGWDTAGRYSVASNAVLAVGNDFSDAEVTTMLGTGNFNAAAGIGFYTAAGNRIYANNLTGARSLTKLGANILTISGVANNYTGTTVINEGTLQLGSTLLSGGLNMTGTGILDLNGNNATFTSSAASGGHIGTSGNTITDNAAGTGTSLLIINNNASQTASLGALVTDGANGRKVGISISNNSHWQQLLVNANNTFSGGILVSGGVGNGSRLYLTSYSSTTNGSGDLTTSQLGTGAVTIGTAANVKGQMQIDAAGAIFRNEIIFNTTLGADLTGGVRFGANNVTLAGRLTANLADASLVNNAANGSTHFVTGQITGASGFQVAANGFDQIVTLNNTGPNANDYDGNTSILRATSVLRLGADNQISDGSGKGNVNVVGTLRMDGFDDTINGLTGTGTVHNNSASTDSALTLGGGNASANFSGVIADGAAATLAITKTGTGTQTLSGSSANTHTGLTTVSGGTLELSKTGVNAIAGDLEVGTGATLLISASNQVNETGTTVTLSGGTIKLGGAVSETFGDLVVDADSFLDFNNAGSVNISFGTYSPVEKITVNNFVGLSTLVFKSDMTSYVNDANYFSFANGFNSAIWDSGSSTFTITAIPEPSTVVAALGLAGLMLWPARRRIVRDTQRILGLRRPMRDRLAGCRD